MSEPGWSFEIPGDVFFGTFIGVLILMAAAAVAATVVRLVRTWQPTHQQRAVDSLSQKMNLVVPEHVREPLARAIAVRKRGSEIGSLVTFVAFAALLVVLQPWTTPAPEFHLAVIIPAITFVSAGTSFGAVVGGIFARRSTPTEHRAARLTPLTFSDLIAPIERKMLVGCLIAGVALPAVLTLSVNAPWTARGNITPTDAVIFLLAGLLAAGLGIALPRIGRMLVAKRAIAGDEHALAWSDALAARTLRDLVHLAATVGAIATMLSLMAVGATLPAAWAPTADVLLALTPFLILGVIVTVVVLTTHRQAERHVQRTLWPQFALHAK